MTQPKHTPEPWNEPPSHLGVHVLTTQDYARAGACVNALAGIEDPAEFVKAAKDLLRFVASLDSYIISGDLGDIPPFITGFEKAFEIKS